jgi:DNA polymerase-1
MVVFCADNACKRVPKRFSRLVILHFLFSLAAMKFFLFDAMSLVFRAFHAMSKMGLQAPNGELTGAVYGFANILATILNKEKPDYIGIAFDTAAPTFRHEMFDKYKAHRPEFPQELVPQLARIKEMITLLNIPQVELAGYEADDIIGTFTKRFSAAGNVDLYCITSDKDYCQLVNDHVRLFRPGFSMGEYDVMDIAGVHTKFGVAPEQVIDVLALIGDASDNVPGVKGIGEKTAIPLIQQYGSLEAVYEHLAEMKDSVRKKLEADRDMAFLSKELVTIDTNVPVTHTLEDFTRKEPQAEALKEFFLSLGFRTIVGKFLVGSSPDLASGKSSTDAASTQPSATPLKTLKDIPHDYVLADTPEKVRAMVDELQSASMLAFDTETDGLNAMACNLVGLSFCGQEGRAFYVPMAAFADIPAATSQVTTSQAATTGAAQTDLFSAPQAPQKTSISQGWIFPEALTPIKNLLENPDVPKCGQNAKFDTLILKRYGIEVAPVGFDTMLASYTLNSDMLHGMDALAQRWLQYSPIPISALIGEKKKDQISMTDVAVERVAEYAAEDADVTFRLYTKLNEQLVNDKLSDFATRVEFPMVEVLTEMEFNGIAIDSEALGTISALIRLETESLKRLIWEDAGGEFNVDSPKQLGEILFEKMQIPPVKKTKTGFSTDSSVLEELSAEHPIAERVLEYRQLAKLQSTYVESLPRQVNTYTGRIHTTYNPTIASTGRLSSTDPNLQNIPIRTELGREIRKAFIADTRQNPDMTLLSADYSQIELRIMAYICKDETLLGAFQQGLDVHAATASVLFGVNVHDVDRDMRRIAKTVNFGVMYGLGAFGLAQRLKIGRGEGKTIIDNYFAKYPRIKEYIDGTIETTRKNGFATTLLGRRKYYPGITSANRVDRTAAERAAINMPIQGTAAEMMKLAMTTVHREMKRQNLQSKMLLQIHDELVFEMHPSERETLPELVKTCMEGALSLGEIPVVVEMGTGKNWAEAH